MKVCGFVQARACVQVCVWVGEDQPVRRCVLGEHMDMQSWLQEWISDLAWPMHCCPLPHARACTHICTHTCTRKHTPPALLAASGSHPLPEPPPPPRTGTGNGIGHVYLHKEEETGGFLK